MCSRSRTGPPFSSLSLPSLSPSLRPRSSDARSQRSRSSSVTGQPADRLEHLELAQRLPPQWPAGSENVCNGRRSDVEWLTADIADEHFDRRLCVSIITGDWYREHCRIVERPARQQLHERVGRHARESV